MGVEKLEHSDPTRYREDLTTVLDEFEEALKSRYIDDLDDHMQVWTVDGERPDPEPMAGAGPGPDRVSIGYNRAKADAPSWATAARGRVELCVPIYDMQDLNKIESAFGQLDAAQKLLGANEDVGDASEIAGLVNKINGRSGAAAEFGSWAGMSGETFNQNFGQFVSPTMVNQTTMARSLANLYAGRACIVESARGNTIAAIQKATKALHETQDSGVETARWTAVSVGAIVVGIASAGVGTAVSIVGVVGSLLDGAEPDQEYANDIEDVVMGLMDALIKIRENSTDEESEWTRKVAELQSDVTGVAGEKLELYDFSGQSGRKSGPPAQGFDVDVDDIRKLAGDCFDASESYEQVIEHAVAVDKADFELRGERNEATVGDRELADLRAGLLSFLQTTCARYYEAGSRLTEAARQYYGADAVNEEILRHLERDIDLNGADKGKGGSTDSHIDKSDRKDIEDWEDYYIGPDGRVIPNEDYR